jgi:hypothetical protein
LRFIFQKNYISILCAFFTPSARASISSSVLKTAKLALTVPAKKKTEKEKKLEEQSTNDKSEKEKQQQEKKVGELIENPEN